MQVSLVLVHVDGQQKEVPLKQARFLLGRDASCQIRLPNPNVSRQHCEIAVDDGRAMLKDLGSSNGTWVNRKRVSQTELAAGDIVNVGPFTFVVRVDGKPAAIDVKALGIGASSLTTAASDAKTQFMPKGKAASKPASDDSAEFDALDKNLDDSDDDFDFLADDDDQPKL